MLEYPLPQGSDAELRWCLAETEALLRFRREASPHARQHSIDETRRWLLRGQWRAETATDDGWPTILSDLADEFDTARAETWTEAQWESFTLHLLWRVCEAGVQSAPMARKPAPVRHRDLLLDVTGVDTDQLVHPFLIRFCGAFLDQGFAQWALPDRRAGFLASFSELYSDADPLEPWLRPLPDHLQRIAAAGLSSMEIVDESLRELGVPPEEFEEFLTQTFLALRGWGGMTQQMETNADWCPHPAPHGALVEFVAIRLLLDRLALASATQQAGIDVPLDRLRSALQRRYPPQVSTSAESRAFTVFQLSQVLGWTPRISLDEGLRATAGSFRRADPTLDPVARSA